MALLVRCSRCNCELSGLDYAYLIRYKDVAAFTLTTLNRTALGMLNDGDNYILCDECMDKFTNFVTGGEEHA